jgi:DNA gyrase subunit B
MTNAYDSSSIQVLEGLEAVRKRPAMYIGDTSTKGLHHCVFEIVDNSIDEALAGFCEQIDVEILEDGSVSVTDDGRGIPVDVHKTEGVPAVEVILCKLHAGGKFDKGTYQVSGGLHGVGVSCVNALAKRLEVEIHRDGEIHEQAFELGAKASDLTVTGKTTRHGTKITWTPDGTIFETVEFSFETLAKRLREMAFLMGRSGLVINIKDARDGREETHCYPAGLEDFIGYINESKSSLHPKIISVHGEATESSGSPLEIDLAMQYNDTSEGGTHLSGFRAGLTRALNGFAKRENLFKSNEVAPSGDDFREGLAAVLSLKVADPQFESQTKIKLGNREVEGLVASMVFEQLNTLFEESPALGKTIINKALLAARARDAARKQRDLVRRKGALASGNLPGKLADCQSKQRDETELFIVEGDSAGGTAKSARDRVFQAILPLRGKILNVEKARIDKMLNHEEIQVLITALGTGFGTEDFDLEKLRYGKVIIMTDADVDGSHIRTLLLTFLFRQMPELVKAGRIYIAEPPLYKLRRKKVERYIVDELALKQALLEISVENTEVRRVDGQTIDGGDTLSGERMRDFLGALLELGRYEGPFLEGRRGLTYEEFLALSKDGPLPRHRAVTTAGDVHTFREHVELNAWIETLSEEERAEVELVEFRNCDEIGAALERLVGFGLGVDDWLASDEQPRFVVIVDGEEHEVYNLPELIETATRLAETGVDIQRYKGLGEMNAEQLWESTMDPERRNLHPVVLQDEVEADHLFSILMGSEVEPRRQFIEQHALEVRNLDV